MSLKYPAPGRKVNFSVDAYCYDSRGKLCFHQKLNSYAKSNWKNSWVTKGWGNRAPGKAWKPGRYRLEVFGDGELVASQGFTVTSSKASLPTWVPAGTTNRGFFALDATVESVRFFEGGRNTPPNKERRFATQFASANTKFLYWQLALKYPKPKRKVDFKVKAVCYKPDGGVLFTQDMSAYVKSGWTSSWHTMGWGNTVPGKAWRPGRYKVMLSVDGRRIAQGHFDVTGRAISKASYGQPKGPFLSLGARAKHLRIFESGYGQPPKERRQFATRFKASSTRFLNWQLDLAYPQAARQADFKITAVCLRQNGSVVFKQSMDGRIKAGWTSSWHSMGWGSKALGKVWRPGDYRLEIWIEGQKMASTRFRVVR